jgi:hypothetical protein
LGGGVEGADAAEHQRPARGRLTTENDYPSHVRAAEGEHTFGRGRRPQADGGGHQVMVIQTGA